ncbi:hypothetical protein OAE31_02945 [Gammaproteobacteria bacterium]|nr:hypothetical protein [Gammaproteobacteria bacterium]MDB9984832.1 hypothetical protein [Gammaproteobacteria bacterium]
MINLINYKNYSQSDLLIKFQDLNGFGTLSKEDQELRDNIYIYLQQLDSQELNQDDVNKNLNPSTSIEDTLYTLGNIVSVLGVIAGSLLIVFAISEELTFLAIWGFAGILSSLISGYVLKGLSKIISLLSSLQSPNSEEQ